MVYVTGMVQAARIDPGHDLFDEVERLKKELNAVILAHFYQDPDLQDVADFIGDSLQLAQEAARTPADVIVFCGVHFMAETAKVLNPDKLVLIPDLKAGCSLADGCPPDVFARFIAKHPGHFVVSYVNCSAAVKALSDVIVTSSNAKRIVERIPEDQPILFAPDRHLGRYIMKETGRDMVLWPGVCQVHELFSEKKLIQLKNPSTRTPGWWPIPSARLPCLRWQTMWVPPVRSSRSSPSRMPGNSSLRPSPGSFTRWKRTPGARNKTFIPAPPDSSCACNECPHMKLNTLEKLYLCMRLRRPRIELDETLRERARIPIQRMLDWS